MIVDLYEIFSIIKKDAHGVIIVTMMIDVIQLVADNHLDLTMVIDLMKIMVVIMLLNALAAMIDVVHEMILVLDYLKKKLKIVVIAISEVKQNVANAAIVI